MMFPLSAGARICFLRVDVSAREYWFSCTYGCTCPSAHEKTITWFMLCWPCTCMHAEWRIVAITTFKETLDVDRQRTCTWATNCQYFTHPVRVPDSVSRTHRDRQMRFGFVSAQPASFNDREDAGVSLLSRMNCFSWCADNVQQLATQESQIGWLRARACWVPGKCRGQAAGPATAAAEKACQTLAADPLLRQQHCRLSLLPLVLQLLFPPLRPAPLTLWCRGHNHWHSGAMGVEQVRSGVGVCP